MGHDAQGRELSEEKVREILAETRPPEGRRGQVEGMRGTGSARRQAPTGRVGGAVVDAGAPISPNQVVPPVGVAPVGLKETAEDGGGVILEAGGSQPAREPGRAPEDKAPGGVTSDHAVTPPNADARRARARRARRTARGSASA
jgi:hypothetical protein